MYEKTMGCADMIMASHGAPVAKTFALCNLDLGQRENDVFFYLITQNAPSRSLLRTVQHSMNTNTSKWSHTSDHKNHHSTNPLIA